MVALRRSRRGLLRCSGARSRRMRFKVRSPVASDEHWVGAVAFWTRMLKRARDITAPLDPDVIGILPMDWCYDHCGSLALLGYERNLTKSLNFDASNSKSSLTVFHLPGENSLVVLNCLSYRPQS